MGALAFISTRGLTIAYVVLSVAWLVAKNKPMAVYFAAAAVINEAVLAMNR